MEPGARPRPLSCSGSMGVLPPVDHSPKECLFPFPLLIHFAKVARDLANMRTKSATLSNAWGQMKTLLDVLHIVLDNNPFGVTH
jgi:hypothetical protein